jgi:glycine/D-amino acid oxidase-like deaminating enzyme
MDYPSTLDMQPTLAGLAMTTRAIVEDFPGLRQAPVDRTWAGLLPFTSDTLPLVGELEPGLWIASGHVYGNAVGPITGKLVASAVTGYEPEIDLSECRFDRDLPMITTAVATRW